MTAAKRILVLEDRDVDRKLLTTLLGYRGFVVFEAAAGVRALAIAAEERLDLVISDVLMPGMDGYEFVRRLRLLPACADLPVIFYTATYHEKEARALAEECGVIEFLIKPTEPPVILARVDEALARGRVSTKPIVDEPFDRHHARLTADKLVEKVTDLEESERRMAAMVGIGRQFVGEHNPVALLDRVCGVLSEATRATYALVALLNDDGTRLSLVFTSGHEPDIAEKFRSTGTLPPPMRAVVDTGRAVRGRTPAGRSEYFDWLPPVSSYLLLPLASRDRVLGLMAVSNKVGAEEFSEADEQVAVTLGVQAGIAYENALLVNRLAAQTAELREREATTEFALSAAGIAVYERDLLSNRFSASKGLAELLGVGEGTAFADLFANIDPADAAARQAAVDRAIKDRADFSVDLRVVRPEGGVRHLLTRGHIESDSRGAARRVLCAFIDMTDRRLLEAQLRQAQKMEAVGQLAAGIAHDFNNVLTVIQGYSRFLMESARDEEQTRDVRAIAEAGDRAAALTRQLLAFSRKQAREITVFDLNALIKDLTGMLKRLIGEHVAFQTRLGSALGPLKDDRGQIEQVIVNLVVNARDAMPSGGRITIETSAVGVDGREWIRLSVADTGTGMSDDVRQRIFEPFFTTKPAGKGTGLGLATVFGIVTQSGGRISVDSEVGKGTVFTVLLPRAVESVEAPVAPEEVAVKGTERLLLVEDDAAIRRLMQTLLTRAGYAVSLAASAKDAVRLMSGNDFDLLIADVLMPGMTGPDLFAELSSTRPLLKVLFVSGYAPEETLDMRKLDGRRAFLAKPFTPEALSQKVREVLDR